MVNKREIRALCMTLQSVWKIFINYVSAIFKFIDICYFSKNESGHRGYCALGVPLVGKGNEGEPKVNVRCT